MNFGKLAVIGVVAGTCCASFTARCSNRPWQTRRKWRRQRYAIAMAMAQCARRLPTSTTFAESLALIIQQRNLIAESTFAETIPSAGKHRREVTALVENAVAKILNVEVPSDKFARSGADLSARAAGFAEGH